MKKITITILFILVASINAEPPSNFSKAKKIAGQIFKDNPKTLYCGCSYDNRKQIDLASCNMHQAINVKRAHQLEWEHMMPAENFGRQFKCWREKICKDKKGVAYRPPAGILTKKGHA